MDPDGCKGRVIRWGGIDLPCSAVAVTTRNGALSAVCRSVTTIAHCFSPVRRQNPRHVCAPRTNPDITDGDCGHHRPPRRRLRPVEGPRLDVRTTDSVAVGGAWLLSLAFGRAVRVGYPDRHSGTRAVGRAVRFGSPGRIGQSACGTAFVTTPKERFGSAVARLKPLGRQDGATYRRCHRRAIFGTRFVAAVPDDVPSAVSSYGGPCV